MDNIQAFLALFPHRAAVDLEQVPAVLWQGSEELRLRRGYPAILISEGREYTLSGSTLGKIDQILLNDMINKFLNYSDYAHRNEISNGFIALPGGHRAGFCGQTVLQNETIHTIRDISSINIRLAKELPEAAAPVLDKLLTSQGRFENTVIASPPGCGKTTLLRSLIRKLSESGYHISVCDERNEIAGSGPHGFSFDLGKRTDVMVGCPKQEGMIMMMRSMGPQILATDEIGTVGEVNILRRGVCGGVKLLTTVHAKDFYDVMRGPLGPMIRDGLISRIIFLSDCPKRGTITGIWRMEDVKRGEGK